VEVPAAERKMHTRLGVMAILSALVHVRELPIVVISKEIGVLVARAHVQELVITVMIIILSGANHFITHERVRMISGGTWALVLHIVQSTRKLDCAESEMPTDRYITAPPGTSF